MSTSSTTPCDDCAAVEKNFSKQDLMRSLYDVNKVSDACLSTVRCDQEAVGRNLDASSDACSTAKCDLDQRSNSIACDADACLSTSRCDPEVVDRNWNSTACNADACLSTEKCEMVFLCSEGSPV